MTNGIAFGGGLYVPNKNLAGCINQLILYECN